jgi:hypothetical protein
MLRGALFDIITYTRSFPYTPILCRSRMSGRKKIAPVANISCSKYYIRYIPRPTCRGSVPLYVPPLAIKGEACNITTQDTLRPSSVSQVHTSSQAQYMTHWSRVLRFGGPNHSKSSRVHVLGDRLARQAKRLSPLLILGFRAGALRHPAGEFPLRQPLLMVYVLRN